MKTANVSRKRVLVCLTASALLGGALLTGLQAHSAALTNIPAGCDQNRVAVAYESNGGTAPKGLKPITCANLTGFGGAETHIKTLGTGQVVEEPAVLPAPTPDTIVGGLVLSSDNGQTWNLIEPGANPFPGRSALEPDGNTIPAQDVGLYVDRKTSRIFVAVPSGFGVSLAGEVLLYTSPLGADGYTQWTATPMHGSLSSENSRFTSAPAPQGQPKPVPAEQGEVSYWCGDTNSAVSSPPILARVCFRSLDGGATWEKGAILFTAVVPQHSECGTNSESFGALDGNYPQGAPNGQLYLMVQCGGTTYLAVSKDEAATFPIIHRANGTAVTIPGSPRELRVDSAGNLYAVGLNGTALQLSVSRDGGFTWSPPVNMTIPAVRSNSIFQWQVAVGYQPGQVAVSYLVPSSYPPSPSASSSPLSGAGSGPFDGYLSVTYDALATNPVFYGGMINQPGAPIVSKSFPGDDFIDVDLGADGTPWAAFYSDCPSNGTVEYCSQDNQGPLPEGNSVTGPQAETVGRLLWTQTRPTTG